MRGRMKQDDGNLFQLADRKQVVTTAEMLRLVLYVISKQCWLCVKHTRLANYSISNYCRDKTSVIEWNLSIRHMMYNPVGKIAKNTLLRTAFSVILPTGNDVFRTLLRRQRGKITS